MIDNGKQDSHNIFADTPSKIANDRDFTKDEDKDGLLRPSDGLRFHIDQEGPVDDKLH